MMNSPTYILTLVLFSAAFIYSLGADGSPSPTSNADTTSSETGKCIEVTLPNVLGIGKCLGPNLDLCQNEKTLLPGVVSLVNCTVTSLYKNLSPENFLVTVKDILVTVVNKVMPPLSGMVGRSLARRKLSDDVTIANNICEGEIKIKIPNHLGKCLDNTLMLCEKGKPIDMSLLESLGRSVGCIVKDLLTTAPQQTLKDLLCDVIKLVAEVLGKAVKGSVNLFCDRVTTDWLRNILP